MWIVRGGGGDYSCGRAVVPIRGRQMRGRRSMMTRTSPVWPVLCVVVVLMSACSANTQPNARKDHEEEMLGPKVAEDFDASEQRWRKDIADARWSDDDMNLLTDDPPKDAASYGQVAGHEGVKHLSATSHDPFAEDEENAESHGFWDKVGKASFSVLSVAVTVGMMVAPYLLL